MCLCSTYINVSASVSVSMHRLAVLFTCLLLFICVYFIQTFLFVMFCCSSAMFVARAFLLLLLLFSIEVGRFVFYFVASPMRNKKKRDKFKAKQMKKNKSKKGALPTITTTMGNDTVRRPRKGIRCRL